MVFGHFYWHDNGCCVGRRFITVLIWRPDAVMVLGFFMCLKKNGFLKIKTAKASEYSEASPHEKQNTTPFLRQKRQYLNSYVRDFLGLEGAVYNSPCAIPARVSRIAKIIPQFLSRKQSFVHAKHQDFSPDFWL